MGFTPSSRRGPRLTRPHEILDPRRSRADGGAAGAPAAAGGAPVAAGLVFALLAAVILWLDWAYTRTGGEAAALAAVIAAIGAALALFGWRATRARGASGRGPLAVVAVALVPLALAIAGLVSA
jgi:hypothetical protein